MIRIDLIDKPVKRGILDGIKTELKSIHNNQSGIDGGMNGESPKNHIELIGVTGA